LSLFKIRRFLSTGLRLSTACDLELDGDLTIARPNGWQLPDESVLLPECTRLIGECKSHFADPAITEVQWEPGKKGKGKDKKSASSEGATDTEADGSEETDE